MTGGRLALLLSVDDLQPEAGGDVNFTLTAGNTYPGLSDASDYIDIIKDINIRVELSAGLEFKAGWSPPEGFATSGQSATWQPDAVDPRADRTAFDSLVRPSSQEVPIQTRLTSESLAAIPLEERCITARVSSSTPPPPPDYLFSSLKQCLGDDPPLLFEQGVLQAFTPYPCVDASGTAITTHPCDASGSTSEIVVIAVAESDTGTPGPRLQGVGRSRQGVRRTQDSKVVLLPENGIIVQVKDPFARVVSGSTVTWQTGRTTSGKTVAGVRVNFTAGEFLDTTSGKECPGTATCRWSNADFTVKVEGLSQGSTPPGGVSIKFDDSSEYQHFDANSDNSYTSARATWDLGQYVSSYISEYFLEFSTLGTHVIDFKAGVTRRSDSVVQEDTGSYTFHVGPIAELEARDGGANPELPAGQRAFTIVAVNNGPDDALAAQVTVTGLNAADCDADSAQATKGTVAWDSVNSECTWTIGELITKDVSQGGRGRDGEVLTIITSAAVDTEITAAISNTQEYQVCIDSDGNDVVLSSPSSSACTNEDATNTWHTTAYYDYISDNDSATIKAKDGTGADLPVIESVEAVGPAAIKITWGARTQVNGRRVTHYEVQRQTNPWMTVADKVTGTRYVDTGMEAGDSPRYRVRAVNDFDQPGPWSQPSGGRPGAPTNFTAAVAGATQIRLSVERAHGRNGLRLSPRRFHGRRRHLDLAARPTGNGGVLHPHRQHAGAGRHPALPPAGAGHRQRRQLHQRVGGGQRHGAVPEAGRAQGVRRQRRQRRAGQPLVDGPGWRDRCDRVRLRTGVFQGRRQHLEHGDGHANAKRNDLEPHPHRQYTLGRRRPAVPRACGGHGGQRQRAGDGKGRLGLRRGHPGLPDAGGSQELHRAGHQPIAGRLVVEPARDRDRRDPQRLPPGVLHRRQHLDQAGGRPIQDHAARGDDVPPSHRRHAFAGGPAAVPPAGGGHRRPKRRLRERLGVRQHRHRGGGAAAEPGGRGRRDWPHRPELGPAGVRRGPGHRLPHRLHPGLPRRIGRL